MDPAAFLAEPLPDAEPAPWVTAPVFGLRCDRTGAGWWEGWTYPGYPSVSHEVLATRWADAVVALDRWCTDLTDGRVPIRFIEAGSEGATRLRVSFPLVFARGWWESARRARTTRREVSPAHWCSEAGVWVRFSKGLTSYPRREVGRGIECWCNLMLVCRACCDYYGVPGR